MDGRWFNSGFKQDSVTNSSPDRTSVKSKMGFRAETMDSITSVSYQRGLKCAVIILAPKFVLKLFLAPISDPVFCSVFPNE